MVCSYGEEVCCCNRCRPAITCECDDYTSGRYLCIDWCKTAWCDEGCDPWMLRTVDGCLYCSQILKAADAAIKKAAEAYGTCTTDGDCVQVRNHKCGKHCPIIAKHLVKDWEAAAALVHQDYCLGAGVCFDEWCHDDGCECPDADPRCVEGVCRAQ
ncbi:MAG: hypothetical protein AMXMBFR64_03120 [Myxococcales bacterium]